MKGKKGGKGKGKKPKKSGKGKRDSEWTHEGGVGSFTPHEKDGESGAPTPRFRKTQEMDERMRRSKFKHEMAKKEREFKKKMAAKVTFADVVGSAIQPKSLPQSTAKRTKVSEVEDLSEKAVLVKLRELLNSKDFGMKTAETESEETTDASQDESEYGSEEDYDKVNGEQAEEKEEAEREEESLFGVDGVEDVEVNDENSEELEEPDAVKDEFTAFFSLNPPTQEAGSATLREKSQKIRMDASTGMEISGSLSTLLPPPSISNYSKLRDIPNLNKLWRSRGNESLDPWSALLLPYLSTYSDVMIEGRTPENDALILRCVLLHSLKHVLRARFVILYCTSLCAFSTSIRSLLNTLRSIVLKHNYKIKSSRLAAIADVKSNGKKRKSEADSAALNEEVSSAMQDQGFTRARVLILCPFRGTALQCIHSMRDILGPNTTISNAEKLREEFGCEEEVSPVNASKPADWKALFEGQNVDDDFKMGIQVNAGHGRGSGPDKGVYLRLFSDFYQSDIILASPLGLRLLIENKGKEERDFLSSIESIYIHQGDVLYYQNWDHVDFVMRNVNALPSSDRGTDFSRVRPYFLEGFGHRYRQLILSTAFLQPVLQALFREFGTSLSHSIRCKGSAGEGSILDVVSKVKQIFHKVSVTSLVNEDRERFDYFISQVVTPILRMKQGRTLIVTPSYLHYIKVRNYLIEHEANAAFICEYSRDSEISRARSRFFHGKHEILLYSGRAHFFRRFHLRGALHLVFYSLPEKPEFYPEFVNMLSEAANAGLGDDMSCTVLFTKYEYLALERIIGAKRCAHIASSEKATFMFQ